MTFQQKLSQEHREALAALFKAIEHIKLPLLLTTEQAEVYNELMFATVYAKTLFEWES